MHLMVDLETMGTSPGAAIVSIGAVAFDPARSVLGSEFYRVISLRSCADHGLSMDPDTVIWWLGQGDDPRRALTAGAADLRGVLEHFAAWYRAAGIVRIWGHGAGFDEPLLAAAFGVVGIAPPWKFWDSRCARTLFELANVKPDRSAGTHHNALDDARAQAEAACRAYHALGLAAPAEPPSAELEAVAAQLA